MMTLEETAEYNRIRSGIIKVLEKHGGYEPAVDDIQTDWMATDAVYMKRLDAFLDSDTATEHTYARVIDSNFLVVAKNTRKLRCAYLPPYFDGALNRVYHVLVRPSTLSKALSVDTTVPSN